MAELEFPPSYIESVLKETLNHLEAMFKYFKKHSSELNQESKEAKSLFNKRHHHIGLLDALITINDIYTNLMFDACFPGTDLHRGSLATFTRCMNLTFDVLELISEESDGFNQFKQLESNARDTRLYKVLRPLSIL